MTGYITTFVGPLAKINPQPFYTYEVKDALDIIEQFIVSDINLEEDGISIYAIPDVPGRAELVWTFLGIYTNLPEEQWAFATLESRSGIEQGKLFGHKESLYDELVLDYILDEVEEEEPESASDVSPGM